MKFGSDIIRGSVAERPGVRSVAMAGGMISMTSTGVSASCVGERACRSAAPLSSRCRWA